MKKIILWYSGLLVLLLRVNAFGQAGPPPLPADPWLNLYEFPTNLVTAFGGAAPLAYTNVFSTPVWEGNALVVEMSNAEPAYLQYPLIQTNGNTNLSLAAGTVFFLYAPNWASANSSQMGTGPGGRGYFLGVGDWRSNAPYGFLGLFTDPGGTNVYLAGMSNGVSTTYVSAPISWATNVWHQLDFEWSPSNSFIYIDSTLAAAGAGVAVVPATNVWTNGFFIGSDASGYEQARGAFWRLETWDEQLFGNYTNSWASRSNAIAVWQGVDDGGGFGAMFEGGGIGSLIPTNGCGCGCVSNTAVYLTNVTAAPGTNATVSVTFTIEGGTNGLLYDVFTTTNLTGNSVAASSWTWLGQGTNCGAYQVAGQPAGSSYYVLGTPALATDYSGFTAAYEALVIKTDPFLADSGSPAMLLGWAYSLGLNPSSNYAGSAGARVNYTYDGVGRVQSVSGARSESLANDAEGNVLSSH